MKSVYAAQKNKFQVVNIVVTLKEVAYHSLRGHPRFGVYLSEFATVKGPIKMARAICPSVRIKQLENQWTYLHEI
jgi:hypothetical protein